MINKGAQSLKGKDAQTFKSLAKFHDSKNYKKGMKATQKLLQTNPDHPQTLAMKALFQSALGQEDKALETAKNALVKSKFNSLLCWHTYGSIWKSKKNFIQAAKCFANAVRLDPHNLQLLRQVANLYIQIRDHSNHITTRYSILKEKPNLIQHWVGFVLSYHLKGDMNGAFKALQSLQSFLLGYELKPVQWNHYYLYRILCFRDAQNFDGMKTQLLKYQDKILDKVKWREHMLFCSEKLGNKEGAENQIRELIKEFPQNAEYLDQYHKIIGVPAKDFYKKINQQFGSKIAKVLQLRHTEEVDQFKNGFSAFIKDYYKRNLPSLYRQIQILYSSQEKQNWIGEIFINFEKSLSQAKYPDGQQLISPSEYLWSMFMLSQHYSRKFQNLEKAQQFITKAIAHTNTVSQMYIVKAQIEYKRHNNFQALKTINEARKTDLADRYMNNICVKYLMKCQKPDTAQQVLRMFMKDEANLYQLQNQWYIIQAGKAFLKERKFGPGLKHLNFIQQQFTEMIASQYDFHIYCIRKWTLSEYVELIAYNDNIYQDKKYIQAAGNAIPYLIQYNIELQNPKKEDPAEEKQEDKGGKKKKKNKKKNANQTEELPPLQQFRKKLDYYGKDYLEALKDPLKEAFEWANNSVSAKYTNKNNKHQNKLYFQAFSQSINIFIEFKKPMLVIKALKKLRKTDYCKFEVHLYTIKSLIYLEKALKQTTDDLVRELIDQFLKQALGNSKTVEDFHDKQIKSWKQSETKRIKLRQSQVIIRKQDKRKQYINMYLDELARFVNTGQKISIGQLEILFYVVHKLQFYGELDQKLKTQLQEKFSQKTSYFSQWHQAIGDMPPSTWSSWWLSDYDQMRQELDAKEKQQKDKTDKQSVATEANKK